MRYLIIIESTQTGYSAYAPDLPGCIATGHTKPEVVQSMHEAILFHLEGLREDGELPPRSRTDIDYFEIPNSIQQAR